jgi:peroxiredoxin
MNKFKSQTAKLTWISNLLIGTTLAIAATASGDDGLPNSPQKRTIAKRRFDNFVLPDFSLPSSNGETLRNRDFERSSALILVFLGCECPLAKSYALKLDNLRNRYAARGVEVLGVMSNQQDSPDDIKLFVNNTRVHFAVVKDTANAFANQVGATRTPEVFLYDSNRMLRYQGRIDDQFGVGTAKENPIHEDLEIALSELLAGKPISVTHTTAVGCLIGKVDNTETIRDQLINSILKDQPLDLISYEQHVAPIFLRSCVGCHQAGEIAPFAMTDYDEVVGWAEMIAETVSDRRMPPWHAGPKSTEKFSNDRRLTDQEIALIQKWAANPKVPGVSAVQSVSFKGGTQGNADSSSSSSVRDADGHVWQLPQLPDHRFQISRKPVDIPATGVIEYQYFVIDPGFKKDVWVKAMEVRPGNRKIVHHVLVFARPKGLFRHRKPEDGVDERGFLESYVPGARVVPFPPGYAKRIPAHSELVFQVHYTVTGTPQTDLSDFGIVVTDPSTITNEIITDSVINGDFEIPPGEPCHQVEAKGTKIPKNAEVLGFMPHMHRRGKSFRYELQNGSAGWFNDKSAPRSIVLDVPQYDFNWQTTYWLSKPIKLPKGGKMFGSALFDNSVNNENNPDPKAIVRWGEQTFDEMMLGYFHYAVPRK